MLATMLKKPVSVSFRGVEDDEESRISFQTAIPREIYPELLRCAQDRSRWKSERARNDNARMSFSNLSVEERFRASLSRRSRSMKGKETNVHVGLLGLVIFAAGVAFARPGAQTNAAGQQAALRAPDAESGFGKPETITGTISVVEPGEGAVMLARRGPTEPPSTELVGNNGQVTALQGPGETNYSFRVTSSTIIKVGGQPAKLADLAELQDKQATVRFVPKRDGNFATSLEVNR
jgi:hypothetical protein